MGREITDILNPMHTMRINDNGNHQISPNRVNSDSESLAKLIVFL